MQGQSGLLNTAKRKIGATAGHTKSAATDKIMQVYKNVWKEYNNYLQTQQGMGGMGHTGGAAAQVLKAVGFPDDVIQSAAQATKVNPAQSKAAVNQQQIGNFIYKTVQLYYQGQISQNYEPQYQIPDSL